MVEKSPLLKQAWSKKLEVYFETLDKMIGEGKMEECNDVCLYQHDGQDKHGLDLWLRKRGSNRSENMHQKMRVAFGSHGVGAEVVHHLLVMVTHRCNINNGIRRKGRHNFGMPCHNLIGRTQIRMMQLFGHDIFPHRVNQRELVQTSEELCCGWGWSCDM